MVTSRNETGCLPEAGKAENLEKVVFACVCVCMRMRAHVRERAKGDEGHRTFLSLCSAQL